MAADIKIRRALISVYDKTGVVDFARALHDEFGIEIISTGGTAKILSDAGIPVRLVEDITGFPEMLDGRVKTLHPKIHAAILADRDNPEHMRQLAEQGIEPIDMVVVNLYPFEKTVADPDCTFEQAIEMIDIGGPCLLRAAAKNHRHVLAVSSASLYGSVLEVLRGEPEAWSLNNWAQIEGLSVFKKTHRYDAAIWRWWDDQPTWLSWDFSTVALLCYGENPHQSGQMLTRSDDPLAPDLAKAVVARLGEDQEDAAMDLSFNNYSDASAALELCAELTRAKSQVCHQLLACATPAGATPCVCNCVFIKHTNACGVGVGAEREEAYRQAYLGDPNAAMGGILVVSFNVDAGFAVMVMETYQRFGKPLKEAGHPAAPGAFFIDVWVAPSFDEEAVRIIRGTAEPTPDRPDPPKKNWGKRVRLLEVGNMAAVPDPNYMDIKGIAGGVLMQTRDLVGLNEEQWKVVTEREPSEREMADLRLAWLVCKHTKSNAISICRDGMLIGNGAGQMSRVMSCRIAAWLARENGHADKLPGSAAASDAFFPFRDGPGILIDAGVTAIIQPGGSKRDAETIAACNERDVAMIFTGTRHFKH